MSCFTKCIHFWQVQKGHILNYILITKILMGNAGITYINLIQSFHSKRLHFQFKIVKYSLLIYKLYSNKNTYYIKVSTSNNMIFRQIDLEFNYNIFEIGFEDLHLEEKRKTLILTFCNKS